MEQEYIDVYNIFVERLPMVRIPHILTDGMVTALSTFLESALILSVAE